MPKTTYAEAQSEYTIANSGADLLSVVPSPYTADDTVTIKFDINAWFNAKKTYKSSTDFKEGDSSEDMGIANKEVDVDNLKDNLLDLKTYWTRFILDPSNDNYTLITWFSEFLADFFGNRASHYSITKMHEELTPTSNNDNILGANLMTVTQMEDIFESLLKHATYVNDAYELAIPEGDRLISFCEISSTVGSTTLTELVQIIFVQTNGANLKAQVSAIDEPADPYVPPPAVGLYGTNYSIDRNILIPNTDGYDLFRVNGAAYNEKVYAVKFTVTDASEQDNIRYSVRVNGTKINATFDAGAPIEYKDDLIRFKVQLFSNQKLSLEIKDGSVWKLFASLNDNSPLATQRWVDTLTGQDQSQTYYLVIPKANSDESNMGWQSSP